MGAGDTHGCVSAWVQERPTDASLHGGQERSMGASVGFEAVRSCHWSILWVWLSAKIWPSPTSLLGTGCVQVCSGDPGLDFSEPGSQQSDWRKANNDMKRQKMLFITYSFLPWCHQSGILLFFWITEFIKSIRPRHIKNTLCKLEER